MTSSPAVGKVETACGGSVDGTTIGVWGLTFKANTDDRRDSPSLQVVRRLVDRGAKVQAFDPTVPGSAGSDDAGPDDLRDIILCSDPYEAATGAAVVVVLTEWDEFRWLDFGRMLKVMGVPSIIDARNLLDPAAVRRMGFTYAGIGRQSHIVVAGGAGFLGSHMCDHLMARGDRWSASMTYPPAPATTWPT